MFISRLLLILIALPIFLFGYLHWSKWYNLKSAILFSETINVVNFIQDSLTVVSNEKIIIDKDSTLFKHNDFESLENDLIQRNILDKKYSKENFDIILHNSSSNSPYYSYRITFKVKEELDFFVKNTCKFIREYKYNIYQGCDFNKDTITYKIKFKKS